MRRRPLAELGVETLDLASQVIEREQAFGRCDVAGLCGETLDIADRAHHVLAAFERGEQLAAKEVGTILGKAVRRRAELRTRKACGLRGERARGSGLRRLCECEARAERERGEHEKAERGGVHDREGGTSPERIGYLSSNAAPTATPAGGHSSAPEDLPASSPFQGGSSAQSALEGDKARRTHPPFFASQASICGSRSFRIFRRYSMFAIAVSVGRREPAAMCLFGVGLQLADHRRIQRDAARPG